MGWPWRVRDVEAWDRDFCPSPNNKENPPDETGRGQDDLDIAAAPDWPTVPEGIQKIGRRMDTHPLPGPPPSRGRGFLDDLYIVSRMRPQLLHVMRPFDTLIRLISLMGSLTRQPWHTPRSTVTTAIPALRLSSDS